MADGTLLFMENEHWGLVDALPYIDTQLGQSEVAQQVKALIEEEMRHFEPRDYLALLPAPELPLLAGEAMQQEFARIEAGKPLTAIDLQKYNIEKPQGNEAQNPLAWKKAVESLQVSLEYNSLRQTNLELLEKWGKRAWIAHSLVARATERLLQNEANQRKEARDEVNKKRKLDQISCGNELRKLTRELEQWQQDNAEVQRAVQQMEANHDRLKRAAIERGVLPPEPTEGAAEGEGVRRMAEGDAGEPAAKKAKVGDA